MERFRTLTAAALLLLSPVLPGQDPPRSFPLPEDIRQLLDVRSAVAQELFLPLAGREPLTVRLSFGGSLHTAQLRPYDVRSPDFRVLLDDGNQLREIPPPPSVTYRGQLLGEPGSAVAATVIHGQLRAQLRTGGKIWSVQPASDAAPGMPATAHVIYQRSDVEDLPFSCATLETPVDSQASAPEVLEASSLKIAKLAIDADEPFYRDHNRSATSVQNDVTGIVNAVNVIYTRDVGIEHEISTIIIRTQRVYNANGTQLLYEFRSRWNSSHNNVDRDVAHLFTGRNPSGNTIGVAFVDTICEMDWAYGVSWTTYTSNSSLRTGLTAHELGHGWGARHCDSLGDCRIMCSVIAGCDGDVASFGSPTRLAIESSKNGLDCLSDPGPTEPPAIATASPSAVTSFLPGQVTLTGTEFTQVSSVTVEGMPASFTIVSPETLQFTPPGPMNIGTVEVSVVNAIGAGTIDLTVVGNHPSVLEIPLLVGRETPAPYRVHTDSGWGALLVLSGSLEPSIVPGIVDLAIGNDFTDVIILQLYADTRGVAEVELAFPAVVPSSTRFYWQAATFDPANVTFPLEVSNQVSTFVF